MKCPAHLPKFSRILPAEKAITQTVFAHWYNPSIIVDIGVYTQKTKNIWDLCSREQGVHASFLLTWMIIESIKNMLSKQTEYKKSSSLPSFKQKGATDRITSHKSPNSLIFTKMISQEEIQLGYVAVEMLVSYQILVTIIHF